MYEANTAVIGRIVTHPVRRALQNGEQVLSFRLASTARRYDAEAGDWVDGGTLYLTVSCWRRGIVEGVEASLQRGDPIIAYGQLRSNEYTTRDGAERTDLEMRALALGPDLGRCTAPVVRKTFGRPDRTDPVQRPSADAGTAGEPATTHR
ncbi:single-stranded DNA-binding protein [Nocardia seriolae]|uniref:single-stranded DNA-binding protein n=1 Tax=Nocardia seriolae TaxID=37332 RepID=UPI00068F6CD7|nr:single-stranded DNA-binding protein [Nocardia seriolae]MTJ65526.1 single-stranded DNA-binding protein [Nocardia seriolae]MTJ74549.1 single-stranded DNA-binding protein [Nocardia seriolae]MTJ90405.1 single-stranded DNA-binding protein [Nocardia seriolae]MTK34367.1 single-stranded DNA-binding protein [Nocardia seriolae]MTK43514.1 single-stranded DNA-binding protein [Nocardia seriolae]